MEKPFEIKNVTYAVTSSGDERRRLVITPELEINSKAAATLIGCLELDSHEMLPSLRIAVKKGKNIVTVKPVVIIFPEGVELDYAYRMDMKISHDGREYQIHSSELVSSC